MRVAIVHYHLKRGGVTRVIESTLRGFDSLDAPPQCAVLAGEVPDDVSFKEHAHVVDGLHYSNTQETTPNPIELLKQLQITARQALDGDPDIWHIHNHSLGKNSAMPGIVSLLAEAGESVLLHMHDFAEDGRPENYRLNQQRVEYAAKLYPNVANVHYGVLNARDYEIFLDTGIDAERLHLLANPVEAQHTADTQGIQTILETLNAKRLLLYPVRAVRRKNFGEILLWAALADAGDVFATTLGPTNQNYQQAYERWQVVAAKHHLPLRFGIGETYDWSFEAIMQSADAILSTSIAEGFGLAFLEPWLFGKAIVGRDLPQITADFKANGIRLDSLYKSIPIPVEWVDLPVLKQAIQTKLEQAYAAYETDLPANAVDLAIAGISPDPGYLDFAGLNEVLQESVIERVVQDAQARASLPKLQHNRSESTIQQNAELINQAYSLPHYGEKLNGIYQAISADATKSTTYLDPASVLKGFLKPERFRLLHS